VRFWDDDTGPCTRIPMKQGFEPPPPLPRGRRKVLRMMMKGAAKAKNRSASLTGGKAGAPVTEAIPSGKCLRDTY